MCAPEEICEDYGTGVAGTVCLILLELSCQVLDNPIKRCIAFLLTPRSLRVRLLVGQLSLADVFSSLCYIAVRLAPVGESLTTWPSNFQAFLSIVYFVGLRISYSVICAAFPATR